MITPMKMLQIWYFHSRLSAYDDLLIAHVLSPLSGTCGRLMCAAPSAVQRSVSKPSPSLWTRATLPTISSVSGLYTFHVFRDSCLKTNKLTVYLWLGLAPIDW